MKKSRLMLLSLLGGLIASNMFGMAGQPVVAVTSTFTNEPVSALLPASESIKPEKTDDNDDQEKNSEEAVDESAANETSEIGTQPIVDEEQTPPKDEASDSEEEVANDASDEAEVSSDMTRADEGQITEEVGTEKELVDAFKAGNNIHLTQDVTLKNTNADITKLAYEGIVISGEREDGGVHTLNITTGDSSLGALAYSGLLDNKYITFRQLNIVNNNFWGIFPSTSASTIRFDTVTYSGPQPIRMTNGWAEFTGTNHFTVNRDQEFAEIGSLHFKSGKTTIVSTSTANSFLWTYSTTKSAGLFVSGGAEVDITSSRYINYSAVSGTKINVDGPGSTLKINTPQHVFGTTSGSEVTATNGGQIDVKASNLYNVTPKAPAITADNNSKINIQVEKAISASTMSGNITATKNSELNLKSGAEMFDTMSGNINATENSSITLISNTQLFGTFSSAEIKSGSQPNPTSSEPSLDTSSITMSSEQAVFGTLSNGRCIVEQGATMNIKGKKFATSMPNSGNDDLFKVAKDGTLDLIATDSLFTGITLGKRIGYSIDGTLNQTVGTMFSSTVDRNFDYKFNEGSKVKMIFNGTSATNILPFTGSSTMTIGKDANVVMVNSGNKLPIISGANSTNNIITIDRAYVEMRRTSVDTTKSPLFEKVKIRLANGTFRQVRTTDLVGNERKDPYVNFEANQTGTNLITTGSSNIFNTNFNNQLKQLIIENVGRPVVTPDPLEVQPGQLEFPVTGTATPGTNLRLRFLGTDGKELVTEGEGRDLTVTTGADGEFSFNITLSEALSTIEKEVNFAIIVEANYPEPDQLDRPVTAYVKQYDPAIVEFLEVPTTLDFGTQNLTDINKDIQPSVGGDFVVNDNRTGEDRVGFSIMVRQNKTFTSDTAAHQLKNSLWKKPLILPDGTVYPGTEGEHLITESDEVFITVDKHDVGNTSEVDLKAYLTGQLSGGGHVPGMIQANFGGESKMTGEKYTAELEWTLLNAPPNA